jgi:hypothetical protein
VRTTISEPFLATLNPKARDDLRRLLIRDHSDRDAIASRLMRYRDQNGRVGPTSSTLLTHLAFEGLGVRHSLGRRRFVDKARLRVARLAASSH